MSEVATVAAPVTFLPGLRPDDDLAAYWLRQVMLRLRREVAWLWHERGLTPGPGAGTLPPLTDAAIESLELSRYADMKRRFFAEDVTAAYLGGLLGSPPPSLLPPPRGSFGWLVDKLDLDDASAFLFALALAPAFDHAVASVVATCQNDGTAVEPTLGLMQRLWDDPAAALELAAPGHPLLAYGLIEWDRARSGTAAAPGWKSGLTVSPLVAHQVLFPDAGLTGPLTMLDPPAAEVPAADNQAVIARRLRNEPPRGLRLVPVVGYRGGDDEATVAATSAAAERRTARLDVDPSRGGPSLAAVAACCWLRGLDLYVDRRGWTPAASGLDLAADLPLAVPINMYVSVADGGSLGTLPHDVRLPRLTVPRLGYEDRVRAWQSELGPLAPALETAVAEQARRFRLGGASIRSIARQLRADEGGAHPKDLLAACRAEVELDLGALAEPIRPRFTADDLVLPHRQARQLDEIRRGMRSLRTVHYEWGTARAWDESGIAALFAGPPGTGKSMAAEVLAAELDLPLYRIDLSQVVDKYIGETEKNLRRLFDASDACDLILLFDEADSLFGKRTDVRDAHDRYANLEISYLLGRMERAKGLTILSTNRKKDLDEAFLRRLRYVVDFPQPDVAERREIWQRNVPPGASGAGLDFDFLAERFALCGGHIRSVMFNACLQSAHRPTRARGRSGRRLRMEDVLVALRRELDKQNRAVSLDQFGPYRSVVEGLDGSEVAE